MASPVAGYLLKCYLQSPKVQNIKGVLDKYNIYLSISNSIEDLKLDQFQTFQLILSMRFHFMRYLNSILFRVSHKLLYYVFIEVDFEK